ncbi:alpha/beta-Hydrolases superfamily protein [Perilla frutescens var. frutescens]|nr:alpha/beta-Hydrolases superfamily protein [Perilla frutescens var. frutescens]
MIVLIEVGGIGGIDQPCSKSYNCSATRMREGGREASDSHITVKPKLRPKIFATRRKSERAVKVMGKPVKFEGVSEELQKILDADMDQVGPRRRAREAFKDIQLSIDHILFKMPSDRLKMTELYEVNSRGLEIFSKSWVPDSSSPKAVICFCHGYGDTCTFFFEGIARKLASSGYGIFAMDYPGFGLSEGLHGYIPKFDLIVDDVIEHYSKVKENPDFRLLPSFLFGQSMGGAVALKVHLKQPDAWNGAVLVAPMCKMAGDVVPPWPLAQILIGMAKLLPKQKLVPQKDLAELAFQDVKKREQTAYNIVAYKHKPRLRTAVELLRTTEEIEQQLEKVSLPLLILHGKDDKVTDPSVSKTLHEKARSQDKTLNLYDNAFHSLLEGEPDDMILKVFDDIISWLDKHC